THRDIARWRPSARGHRERHCFLQADDGIVGPLVPELHTCALPTYALTDGRRRARSEVPVARIGGRHVARTGRAERDGAAPRRDAHTAGAHVCTPVTRGGRLPSPG